MAINFLNSIDLNQNEILHPTIENQPNDTAAGTPVDGQLYYNTTTATKGLKVGENGSWVDVSGVDSNNYVTAGSISSGTVTLTRQGLGDVTFLINNDQITNGAGYITAASLPTVNDGTLTVEGTGALGGTGTFTANDSDSPTISITHDTFGTAGTYAYPTEVITNDTGHITSITAGTAPVAPTITLTGDVTGSGTTSIATTISAGAVDFAMLNAAFVVTETEGIENNDNDVTIPTCAAVKDYVDDNIVGGLVYQGGYNASTNTPNLDNNPNPNLIKQGWTYTVTADGTFFTEQVRVGDVLIAEDDAPTSLGDWTTVQNNIDLASLTQVGIGNVNPGEAIDVSYSNGTATVSVEDSTATNKGAVIVAPGVGMSVAYSNGTATVTNTQTNSANTFAVTITDTATVTHSLGTKDVIIQLYDVTTDETVYADVERASTNTATITFASTPTNSIRVLVQKIG